MNVESPVPNSQRLRILVVGGYGVFGGRVVELLAGEPRLELIVAGRSLEQAHAFCAKMTANATLRAERFDRTGDVTAQLRTLAPNIVIDASGPFQAYGDDRYQLVEAAVALAINYLDLADGSSFVDGIAQFNAVAKEKNIFVLSGVSSFPVLTAAVCRHLAIGLTNVDAITGGIAPSPYASVGQNVIRAIASYAGKPVKLVRDGRLATGSGLTETRRATIAPPGELPLHSTLFSLVDVPDLTILPQQWPRVCSVWMGAGPVPEILHKGLITLAWCVRLRLLPSLTSMTSLFFWAINHLRWGEHRGGMFVVLDGRDADGQPVSRSWHLLAEGNDGPLIPSMAVEAIVCKCLEGVGPSTGARSAIADLELADYDALFARRTITTGFRDARDDVPDIPLYRRVLGTAFDKLPPPVRDMHLGNGERTATGTAEVERGNNPLALLIGWLFRFPPVGHNVPLRVRFATDSAGETWHRTFGTHSFSSRQCAGVGREDKLLVEKFGPFAFAMALVAKREELWLVVRRWSFLGVPLPSSLAPFGNAFESVCDGKFQFNVEIRLPVAGLIIRYRGSLELLTLQVPPKPARDPMASPRRE